ncbi:hypothetical protein QEN19_002528 [Hanseniaspora menglaensis]
MSTVQEESKLVEVVLNLPSDLPIVNIELKQQKSSKKNKETTSYAVENAFQQSFEFDEEALISSAIETITVSAKAISAFTNVTISLSDEKITYDPVTTTIKEALEQSSSKKLNLKAVLDAFTAEDATYHVLYYKTHLGFNSELKDSKTEFAATFPTNFSTLPLQETPEDEEDLVEEVEEPKESKDLTDALAEDAAKKVNEKKEMKLTVEQQEALKTQLSTITSVKTQSNDLLNAVTANGYKQIVKPAVKDIQFTKYNPVPTFYKLRGHAAYISITTLENEILQITAATNGFFLNSCSSNKFDPSAKDELVFSSLFLLLINYSKNFINHFAEFNKKIAEFDRAYYIPATTGQLNKGWLFNNEQYSGDYYKLQERQINSKIVSEESEIFSKWNSTKEQLTQLNVEAGEIKASSETDAEKTLKLQDNYLQRADTEKYLVGFYEDFQNIALKTIMRLATGEVSFLDDDMSYVFDGIAFKQLKDATVLTPGYANSYFKVMKILHSVTTAAACKLSYNMSLTVDFAGKRYIAETTIPGSTTYGNTFSDSVCYGIDDKTGEWVYDSEFNAELSKISKYFHVKPKQVEGKEIIPLNMEGFKNGDNYYMMKLSEFLPTDEYFKKENPNYPTDKYPIFNYELLQNWATQKLVLLSDEEKSKLNETDLLNLSAIDFSDLKNDENFKDLNLYLNTIVIPKFVSDIVLEENIPLDGEELVSKLHSAGINVRYMYKIIEKCNSLLEIETKDHAEILRINKVKNEEYENYTKEIQEKAMKIYTDRQREIQKFTSAGKPVPDELKLENLNLDELLEIRKPNKESPRVFKFQAIKFLKTLAEYEILSRSVKHLFNRYTKDLPLSLTTSLISFVYNLLFGFNKEVKFETLDSYYKDSKFEFSKILTDRASVIAEIQSIAKEYFNYDVSSEFIDTAVIHKPFILIRLINKKFGIQLLNKKYYFTSEQYESFVKSLDKKTLKNYVKIEKTFSNNDFNLIPKIKSSSPGSEVSLQLWQAGLSTINTDDTSTLTFLNEAIALSDDTLGYVNLDSAMRILTLCRLISGKGFKTDVYVRRAIATIERLHGADSYINLSALHVAAVLATDEKNFNNAVLYFKRTLEVAESLLLDGHPLILQILNDFSGLSNLAKDVKQACKFNNLYMDIVKKTTDVLTVAYAMKCSQTANFYAMVKEFKASEQLLESAQEIYNKELGADHEFSLTCASQLNSLKQLIDGLKAQTKLTSAQKPTAAIPAKKSKKGSKK